MITEIKQTKSMEDFVIIAIEKANCHAKEVKETISVLYNELIAVKTHFKKWRSTCLWIEIDKIPYYITYDHELKQILLKEKNCRGRVILRFDDTYTTNDINYSLKKL